MNGQRFNSRHAHCSAICLNFQTILNDNSNVWKGILSMYYEIFCIFKRCLQAVMIAWGPATETIVSAVVGPRQYPPPPPCAGRGGGGMADCHSSLGRCIWGSVLFQFTYSISQLLW